MDTDKGRQTWTIAEAAAILGVATNTAYRAAQRGEIPSIRIGDRLLVPRTRLIKLLTDVAEIEVMDGRSYPGNAD